MDGPTLRRRMNEVWAPDGVPPPLCDEQTDVFEITQDELEAVHRGEYGRAAAEWYKRNPR